VDLARAVDRNADQKIVLAQKRSPVHIELRTVGLDRVRGALARLEVPIDDLDRPPEEIESHQRRFAALPGDVHDRDMRMGFDELTDVGLEQLVGHPEPAARVQHLLGEKEAVRAVQVAHRTGGLRKQMKRWRHRRHQTSIWLRRPLWITRSG